MRARLEGNVKHDDGETVDTPTSLVLAIRDGRQSHDLTSWEWANIEGTDHKELFEAVVEETTGPATYMLRWTGVKSKPEKRFTIHSGSGGKVSTGDKTTPDNAALRDLTTVLGGALRTVTTDSANLRGKLIEVSDRRDDRMEAQFEKRIELMDKFHTQTSESEQRADKAETDLRFRELEHKLEFRTMVVEAVSPQLPTLAQAATSLAMSFATKVEEWVKAAPSPRTATRSEPTAAEPDRASVVELAQRSAERAGKMKRERDAKESSDAPRDDGQDEDGGPGQQGAG